MDDSMAVLTPARQAGTAGRGQEVPPRVLNKLGGAGYWGLLVDKKYGGAG